MCLRDVTEACVSTINQAKESVGGKIARKHKSCGPRLRIFYVILCYLQSWQDFEQGAVIIRFIF